jgi:hypothetical protein
MPPRDAVKLDLVTASIGSRLNEVEIDTHSIRVTEGQGGGQPVSFHQETPGLEDRAAGGNGVRTHNKIDIIMLPCLTPHERVDSLPPVEPGVHPRGLKLAQHG